MASCCSNRRHACFGHRDTWQRSFATIECGLYERRELASSPAKLEEAMLKVSPEQLESMEQSYPGIKEQVLSREEADLPSCASCGSANTAAVNVGVIGRSMLIAGATTKIKLVPNCPGLGDYFCNECSKFWELKSS